MAPCCGLLACGVSRITSTSLMLDPTNAKISFFGTGAGVCEDATFSASISSDTSAQQIFRLDFSFCMPSCDSCDTLTTCAKGSCSSPYYWSAGNCLSKCPDGFYISDSSSRICLEIRKFAVLCDMFLSYCLANLAECDLAFHFPPLFLCSATYPATWSFISFDTFNELCSDIPLFLLVCLLRIQQQPHCSSM